MVSQLRVVSQSNKVGTHIKIPELVFFSFMLIANEEEDKRQNCFVILVCKRSRTDHHHIRFLHWIILTFDPAALPRGVQLLDKATFICFSRLSLPQLSGQQRLPVLHVFFSMLLQQIIFWGPVLTILMQQILSLNSLA